MSTIHSHHGVVHGKAIELDEDTGSPEGQKVTVSVKSISSSVVKLAPGEGLRQSFGAWSDDAEELDRGALTPETDLLIAATALTHNLILVTHNTQDFVNVPGLRLQDRIRP